MSNDFYKNLFTTSPFHSIINWVIIIQKYYRLLIITILLQIIIFSLNLSNSVSSKKQSIGFIYPTSTTNTSSEFGYRELFGKTNFHDGIDFPMPQGSEVYATSSGIVKSCSFISGYGISVIIEHDNGYKSLYGHLDENVEQFVHIGKKVNQGDIIANVGPKYLSNGIQNGNTTGPHLHFTIYNEQGQKINPLSLDLYIKE